jgi:hypothetical protein
MAEIPENIVAIPLIPQPLIDDIAAGRCVPFIGAGFSKNATSKDGQHLPDWNELTACFTHSLDGCQGKSAPEVAQDFEEAFGRVTLLETMAERIEQINARPAAVHAAFAQLPFDLVFTTNFDLLLEMTYDGRNPVVIGSDEDMAFVGGRRAVTIIKLHGDLNHRKEIVLTSTDFGRYLDTHPVMSTYLAAMFIARTFLFIGYSLSDPNILSINSVIRQRLGAFKRRAYWISFDLPADHRAKLGDEQVNVISASTNDSSTTREALFLGILQNIADRVQLLREPLPEKIRASSIRGRGLV